MKLHYTPGPVTTWMGDLRAKANHLDIPATQVNSAWPSLRAISNSESWGVNCTPRDALAPCPWSVRGVWLRAQETEISAAPWALWLGKDFTFNCTFTNGKDDVDKLLPATWCSFLAFVSLSLSLALCMSLSLYVYCA